MRQIVLASGSPRRKELLEKMGLTFTVVPSDFEEWLDDGQSPEAVSMALGLGKARDVATRYPEAVVIGGDTIVTVDGKQLGKAANLNEARSMWKLVTSAPNKITTSVAVICRAENYEFITSESAFVTFKPYDDNAVEAYLVTSDWQDKAGAWSIQKCRGLIASVKGDREVIIGLPTRSIIEPLKDLGFYI